MVGVKTNIVTAVLIHEMCELDIDPVLFHKPIVVLDNQLANGLGSGTGVSAIRLTWSSVLREQKTAQQNNCNGCTKNP